MPKKNPLMTPQKPQLPANSDDIENSAVLEKKLQKTEPPSMYSVILINDDYTPMEFVVEILQSFFNKDIQSATQIMLQIHHQGKSVCGVYTRDVAATKATLVMDAAQQAGHPLQCASEPTGL